MCDIFFHFSFFQCFYSCYLNYSTKLAEEEGNFKTVDIFLFQNSFLLLCIFFAFKTQNKNLLLFHFYCCFRTCFHSHITRKIHRLCVFSYKNKYQEVKRMKKKRKRKKKVKTLFIPSNPKCL